MAFWDDRHGIAFSDPIDGRLFLLATDDAGATWTRIPTDAAPAMLPGEAAFAASGTCLIVQGTSNVWIGTGGGQRARVFRSSDRGRTWSVADTPIHAGNSASGIFSVAFNDAQHGVVVGGQYNKPKEKFDNVAVTIGRRTNLAPRQGTAPGGLHVRRRFRSGHGGPVTRRRGTRRHRELYRWRGELDDGRFRRLQQCGICITRRGLGGRPARTHREMDPCGITQ